MASPWQHLQGKLSSQESGSHRLHRLRETPPARPQSPGPPAHSLLTPQGITEVTVHSAPKSLPMMLLAHLGGVELANLHVAQPDPGPGLKNSSQEGAHSPQHKPRMENGCPDGVGNTKSLSQFLSGVFPG